MEDSSSQASLLLSHHSSGNARMVTYHDDGTCVADALPPHMMRLTQSAQQRMSYPGTLGRAFSAAAEATAGHQPPHIPAHVLRRVGPHQHAPVVPPGPSPTVVHRTSLHGDRSSNTDRSSIGDRSSMGGVELNSVGGAGVDRMSTGASGTTIGPAKAMHF